MRYLLNGDHVIDLRGEGATADRLIRSYCHTIQLKGLMY